jgi:AbrB family looped-hinge helix DNA binding protein
MPVSTLTSKGQITIPKEVRDALGIRAGDRVSFVVREDVVELRPETVDLRTCYGMLKRRGRGGKPVTVEQMNRDIGDAAAETVVSSLRR